MLNLNPQFRDWRGRRIWMVGASSGIGAAMARELLRRGARVALSARRHEPLTELARAFPNETQVLPFDARVVDEWKLAFKSILEVWGGVDLVVLMIGYYEPLRVRDLDPIHAQHTFATNLTAVTNGLSVVVPRLLHQGYGGIALTASVAGYGGLPNSLCYGATKAALIHMAETMHLELNRHGIGVYLINPGFVRTPLTAKNDFPMPALLEPEQATARILRGLERGKFEIAFPRRLAWALKLLRLLPRRLYFPLIRKITGI